MSIRQTVAGVRTPLTVANGRRLKGLSWSGFCSNRVPAYEDTNDLYFVEAQRCVAQVGFGVGDLYRIAANRV